MAIYFACQTPSPHGGKGDGYREYTLMCQYMSVSNEKFEKFVVCVLLKMLVFFL
jgi:hypothetical protein